ncbi:MAG TPA: aminotransferase class V-fold PLP-dependent enzyme [Candidatus Nanoarchaeia archaeon]|nr:aminotransferase class V-fold PLP-dependent enzyme [Candidatus Nanoarchaeia archaeon]
MKKIFFTPGPTQLYDFVPEMIEDAIRKNIPSLSHRGKEFEEIFRHTTSSIKHLLGIPDNFHIFFLSSGTEAMERVIENCAEKCSFHFVNGAFSERFYQTALELRKSAVKIEAKAGKGFDFLSVKIPDETELICFTHNETSTGVAINMDGVYRIKRKNPEKIIAVDIVSSAPYVNIDYSLIDCAFFSVQKGFGMPAGLGVIIVNGRCIDKSRCLMEKGCNIGSYHSFVSLLKHAEKNQTPETPNVLGIYLLGKVCDELNKIGIEKTRKETEKKAEMVYDFFDNHPKYKPFVEDEHLRSKTVIAISTANSSEVIKTLSKQGFIVGSGYKDFKEKQIRIANFPMHKIEDVNGLLKVLGTI